MSAPYEGQDYVAQIDAPDATAPMECGCCEWKGTFDMLAPIEECSLTPGDPSPAGRCPECDSLVYVAVQNVMGAAADALLAQVERLLVRAHAYATDKGMQGDEAAQALAGDIGDVLYAAVPEDVAPTVVLVTAMSVNGAEVWAADDNQRAESEGWGLFDVGGVLHIQRDDEAGKFETDDHAILFVVRSAQDGSAFHRKALRVLADNPPNEEVSCEECERSNGPHYTGECTHG